MADINVGGTIHSTATGNVAVRADEVLDTTQNKKQSVINHEVNNELIDHNSRINALDEQNYKTYTASSGQSLSDILPATGETDTIYRVGKWDGTQYTEDAYCQYSWDGVNNQYKLLQVLNYGIDDYPQENSENLVKSKSIYTAYANQVYLDTVGTVSPLSFDPQADTVHTTEQVLSDAQKQQARENLGLGDGTIDDYPTAGSENLVKSRGVDLRILQNEIYLKSFNDIKKVGFIASNNTWHGYEGAGFCIPTEGITTLAITKKTNDGPNYYAFLKTNVYETGTLSYCSGSDYTKRIQLAKNVPLTSFPNDCKYIWVIAATGSTTLSLDDDDFGLVINGVNMNGNFYAHVKEFVKDIKNGIGYLFPIGEEFLWNSSTLTLTIPVQFDFVTNIISGRPTYIGAANITFPTTGDRTKLLIFNIGTYSFEVISATSPNPVVLGYNQVVLGTVDTVTGNEYFNFPYKKDGYDIIRNGYDSVPTENSNKLLTSGVIKDALDSVTGDVGLLGNAFHGDYLSLAPFLLDYIDSVYWPNEETNFNTFLNTIKNRSGYKIAFITDTHEGGLAAASGEFALRTIALYNKLAEAENNGNPVINICMHGGDISNDYGTSVDRYFAYMQEVMKLFHVPLSKNLLITKGNHDANDSGYREISPLEVDWNNGEYFACYDNETFVSVTKDTYRGGELYVADESATPDSLFRFIQATNAPVDAVWGDGAYYYYDNADIKIRFVVSNQYPYNDDGAAGTSNAWKWLAQTALDLSAKTTPSDWLVVMLRHTEATSSPTLSSVLDAFVNGNSVTVEGITVNYGSLNGGGVKFVNLHGHEHGSAGYSNANGYLDLGFKNAGVEKRRLGNTAYYALYAITINTDGKKVIVDSLLAGGPYTYDYANSIVELGIGQSILMARSGLPKQNQCSWSSSDSNIASVSGGMVTGVSAGTATITGTGNSKTVSYTVKVVS